jgi:hypothetical protein
MIFVCYLAMHTTRMAVCKIGLRSSSLRLIMCTDWRSADLECSDMFHLADDLFWDVNGAWSRPGGAISATILRDLSATATIKSLCDDVQCTMISSLTEYPNATFTGLCTDDSPDGSAVLRLGVVPSALCMQT